MENPERINYFAATDARGKNVPFGIKAKDRDRHMYVIGKTGMGKSTLLENMAIQDLRNGEGLAFIDPHGGTVERLLDYVPKERIKDVVYFAPFDMEHPIAFNVMEDVGYDKRHLVVSGLMATFKKIWEDAWSARMEYILTNTLLALLEYPDATLLGVNRMYTDKTYRQKVVDNVKDPVVKDFWTKEFANYGDRYTQEATPAIQNKIGQFTGNPLIRNIIGQPKSSFDIRTMMDEKKILIINLSKGLVGETNMRLLGSMLTTRIFLGAMSRANLPAHALAKLPNFYFYVDEFQNFANETFAEILSEARKYKLNLIIAHQYIEQMEEEVRDAVFGNVGTTVVFRVGPFDAEVLETIFMPKFTKEDIVALDRRQIYLSLMIDSVGSAPFSATTIPPIEAPPVSFRDEVVAASRAQFAAPRAGVEGTIIAELAASAVSEAPADARMRRRVVPEGGSKKPASLILPQRDVMKSMVVPLTTSTPLLSVAPLPFPPRMPVPEQSATFRRPEPMPRPFASDSVSPTREVVNHSASFTPHPNVPVKKADLPVRTAPALNGKSADDLKAILRTMTIKTGTDREHQKSQQQQSLKGALAAVLEKSRSTSQESQRGERPIVGSQLPKQPERSATAEPSREVLEKKPFEVSEEALRKVFKGDT